MLLLVLLEVLKTFFVFKMEYFYKWDFTFFF